MAFLGLLLLLLLHRTYAELEVLAPSSQSVLNGSSVVLPCTFSVGKLPLDPKYLAILWSFQERQILVYDSKGITKDPRVMFHEEAAKGGNASLTVANATLSDGGTYSCLVVYSPERTEKNIVLEVQVRPVIILPNQTVRKERENTLHCMVVGFFPRNIEITWVLDGKILNNSLIGEPVKNKDTTYNVTSSVIFTPTVETKTLSCTVHHASLHEPLREDMELVYEDRRHFYRPGIIAAIVLVLIIIIGGALWWKRRRKANSQLIEGPPKLIDGEEATLYCTVDNYPENLCVTWLIRRAGQVKEIQTSQMRGHSEEAESLLDTSYEIKSQWEGRQYVTSLRFIPHIERHRDVTFICRGDSKQHNHKKIFHCKTIYVKPNLSQPVMRSLFVCGEMKYLLSLEKFYPKHIKIVWRCGVETTENVLSSTESISDNPDRTYNVSSEVRIPEDRHKDPGFRVRVTWEHESMAKPESRELSIRDKDYSWTPDIEEIEVPRLCHGTPAALQCNISGYFPDAVTVKWLRRPEQSLELYEERDAVVTQKIISRRAADNLYSGTASLTITPTPGTHQGEHYICLVDHPSLENPIEKSTGRLQVYAKPQMLAPIEITMGESSRVQFSLNLQKFYPKEINISWCWENTSGKYVLSPEGTSITRDDHLTYDVTSVVRLSVHQFRDPQMRIIVEWKHEAMETPETRSLSLRDLPWRPHVGSINVPELKDGAEAKLTCDISGYFPDLLSVSWYTKKDGNINALPIEASQTDRTYNISHKGKTQKDKTYSCEATLTFTPLISLDQESEILCRAEHPSLEGPIERSTGPLHIGAKKKILLGSSITNRKNINKLFCVMPDTMNEAEEGEEVDEKTGAEPQEEKKPDS